MSEKGLDRRASFSNLPLPVWSVLNAAGRGAEAGRTFLAQQRTGQYPTRVSGKNRIAPPVITME